MSDRTRRAFGVDELRKSERALGDLRSAGLLEPNGSGNRAVRPAR